MVMRLTDAYSQIEVKVHYMADMHNTKTVGIREQPSSASDPKTVNDRPDKCLSQTIFIRTYSL